MGISSVLLISFLSFTHPFGNLPVQDNVGTIEIKVFRVEPFQSRVISGGSLEDGGVWSTVVGGNVTAKFPDGYIVLKASSKADNQEIIRLIKKKIASYPCSCGDFVQVGGYSNFIMEFDPKALKYKRFEFHNYIHDGIIIGEYSLFVEPIIVNNQVVLLSFEVQENQVTAQALNEPTKYFKEELFNQVMEMGRDQILIVGFTPPKTKSGFRGAAYWLVFSMKNSLSFYTALLP